MNDTEQLTATIRKKTLKSLITSYIQHIDYVIFDSKHNSFTEQWIRDTVSKHVEVFDLIETHNISLSQSKKNLMQANLNFLRAQLEVSNEG